MAYSGSLLFTCWPTWGSGQLQGLVALFVYSLAYSGSLLFDMYLGMDNYKGTAPGGGPGGTPLSEPSVSDLALGAAPGGDPGGTPRYRSPTGAPEREV